MQLDHHARCHIHGHQLLEKQFHSVGETDFGDVRLVIAALAFIRVDRTIGNDHETAQVANVDAIRIRDLEKPL